MTKLKIAIVMSSTRDGRLNDRVTKFVYNSIVKNHEVEIIDPAKIDFPKTQQSMNFLFNAVGDIPENIKALDEKMKGFDAFVIVCAEYNCSIPPPLADLFDNVCPRSVVWKPCGFVNYSIGQLGGCRAGVHLRSFTGALGMISVPKSVVIPFAHERIGEDGTPAEEKQTEDLQLCLEHVYYAANAFKNHREKVTPPPWAP